MSKATRTILPLIMACLFAAPVCADAQWQYMASAPKDGTIIEIRIDFGASPWFGLFKWSDKLMVRTLLCDGGDCKSIGMKETHVPPTWVSVNMPGHSISAPNESHFQWRRYNGDGKNYVDPTGERGGEYFGRR